MITVQDVNRWLHRTGYAPRKGDAQALLERYLVMHSQTASLDGSALHTLAKQLHIPRHRRSSPMTRQALPAGGRKRQTLWKQWPGGDRHELSGWRPTDWAMMAWLAFTTDLADPQAWLAMPLSERPAPMRSRLAQQQWHRRLERFLTVMVAQSWWVVALDHPLMPIIHGMTRDSATRSTSWHLTISDDSPDIATFGRDNWEWIWAWLGKHGAQWPFALVVHRTEPVTTDFVSDHPTPWSTKWGFVYNGDSILALDAQSLEEAFLVDAQTGDPLDPPPFVRYQDGMRLLRDLNVWPVYDIIQP